MYFRWVTLRANYTLVSATFWLVCIAIDDSDNFFGEYSLINYLNIALLCSDIVTLHVKTHKDVSITV